MLERIEVFKAGKHVASDGKVYEFSDADVAGMAAGYNTALLAAPMVLGHPKSDDPAWGWAKSLSVANGVLVADLEKVAPEFEEGIEDGRYRHVSAKFYAPTDPSNPTPGAWYLKHIGFLGAQAPSVKGLQPAFNDGSEEGVAFAEIDASVLKDMFRRWREWLIADKGLDVADDIMPAWYLDAIEIRTAAPAFAEGEQTESAAAGDTLNGQSGADTLIGASGADTINSGDAPDVSVVERTAQLDAREAEIESREVAFAEGERSRAREADGAFVDSLVVAGRLPPVHGERVKAIFARLSGDDGVAFSEPNAEPRAELRQLLDGLGTSIQFTEFAGPDGFDPSSADAAPQIASEIERIRAEAAGRGEHISYSQAAARIGR